MRRSVPDTQWEGGRENIQLNGDETTSTVHTQANDSTITGFKPPVCYVNQCSCHSELGDLKRALLNGYQQV